MTLKLWAGAAIAAAAVTFLSARPAEACGCFTPPDPTVPIVQAGERILFSMEDGKVTAHIQIQYAGNAGEFGWILPLPDVPKLELGTDELFNQLIATTQPKYRLLRVFEGCFSRGNNDTANSAPPGSNESDDGGGSGPLVVQDSIGPYDYAVLKADSKDEMLGWLAENRYFVPAGTDDVVGPYIRPGAYFLALKLRSGESTGDLQPVVVTYASDLPMIPIVLTSVAAQPDMGIQVWMLGAGRAIPRNYFHTVINDARIDWFTGGQNYNDVIIAATKEAEGRHTFVTEYAGPSAVMRDLLDAQGRFGTTAALAAQPDAVSFVLYLNENGFRTFTQGQGPFTQPVYASQLLSLLGRYIPVPPALLAEEGFTASEFYSNIGYYLTTYRQQYPEKFVGYEIDYRPAEMAAEIETRVVKPTLEAGALFKKHEVLTRLYTTLSPEQMDRDPVFSFNPELPNVSNIHEATLTVKCSVLGTQDTTKAPATLRTEQGYVLHFPGGVGPTGTPPPITTPMPASSRIETLAEEGAPLVVLDNKNEIRSLLDDGGCAVAPGGARGPAGALLLLALVLLARRRRHA